MKKQAQRVITPSRDPQQEDAGYSMAPTCNLLWWKVSGFLLVYMVHVNHCFFGNKRWQQWGECTLQARLNLEWTIMSDHSLQSVLTFVMSRPSYTNLMICTQQEEVSLTTGTWLAQGHTEPSMPLGSWCGWPANNGCSQMTHQISLWRDLHGSYIGTSLSPSWAHQQGSSECVSS